jgi:DNA-binding MarR family transcriptional regulator
MTLRTLLLGWTAAYLRGAAGALTAGGWLHAYRPDIPDGSEEEMVRFADMFTELVRVEIELWNDLEAHLVESVGVTLSQHQALAAIRSNGDSSRVQDISREMAITVGAASKVVDRLERDGLAIRSAHPTDRRSSLVALTDTGAQALSAADAAAEVHLRDALGTTLTDTAAEGLLAQLSSMRTHARNEEAR